MGACLVVICGVVSAAAEDWPTYGHDAARSGITAERLPLPLEPCWSLKLRDPPRPAWGNPKPEPVEKILELRRVHFDDVFQPVVAGGAVFFGSSANNKVYCLDAASGRIRWSYITGGPVRLAPTLSEGRVYFGSDDGHVYCLDAGLGRELWQFRAAPEDRRVLGHGKMISLWPVRSGVLVDDGVAYFTAGIFPAEGVFFYAVDAKTGRQIWRNDTCGEAPQSRSSPQGYLLASKATLYVPMGRVSPAAFDRRDGRLLRETFFGKTIGGTYALLADEYVYTGTEEIAAYHAQRRDRFAKFAGRKLVVAGPTAYLATGRELLAVDRQKLPAGPPRWKTPTTCCEALILAGDVLYAGGAGEVIGVDSASGAVSWTGQVEGLAKGLAAADGRLLVSTDKGILYCFGPKEAAKPGPMTEPAAANPFVAAAGQDKRFQQAAETLLKQSGVRRGYCLVMGLETGELAWELANRSELMIYAVSPEADKVAAARKALVAAGVYGTRVCVEQWPLDKVPYADHFANLIVSESPISTGRIPFRAETAFRMLKPLGGVLMIGQPGAGAPKERPLSAQSLRGWAEQSKLEHFERLGNGGVWLKLTRGPLPGAGNWTHQYAEPGNTACGNDTLVKPPLGVLWFGEPGPEKMDNRHARAAASLAFEGRLFIQGENRLMAYDAYNGLKLWEREIPGAERILLSHDCSNLAVGREGLFVAVEEKCLRLDPATGETRATYQVPPAAAADKPPLWGYVATVGKVLYGSRTTNRRQSDLLFAIDLDTGKVRWSHQARMIPHNAIAIGDGTVFLVDSDVSPADRQKALAERQDPRWQGQPHQAPDAASPTEAAAEVGRAVALDARTGQVRWQRPVDLTDCGHFAGKTGILASMYRDGVVVLFGVFADGHYWQQFFQGQFDARRIVALAGGDGKLLWSQPVGFRVRPVIVGRSLHTEPWALDLHTGEPVLREHPVTGQPQRWQFARPGHHCGPPVASPSCLFFRSFELGYYDLQGDYGTMHFGAQRPGCWVNTLPAAGVLLMPEASAGCMCAFPNMCTVVFQGVESQRAWAYSSAPGATTPVRRLALNLGAPGDRRDSAGTLWLGYPRPRGPLVMKLPLEVAFFAKGGFAQRNSTYTAVAGTEQPWLFTAEARGLRRCAIPLLSRGDGQALYRVRLGFADFENDQPGQRVFSIKLQGKTVQERFDVVAAAGGRARAVFQEFGGIEVRDKLTIELVPTSPRPTPSQWPILQAVEIVRERFVTVGCTVADLEVNHITPQRAAELKLSNLREQPFAGTVEMTVPTGFTIAPRRQQVNLAAGQRTSLPLRLTVGENVPAGKYALGVKLAATDGTLQAEETGRIEHLGRRGRLVLPAIADAHVHKRDPGRNRGSADTLLIDGGEEQMGDLDHTLIYLRFRVAVPGKPLSARLRLHNAGNPSDQIGRVCLTTADWKESAVTYQNRPPVGQEVGRLGAVAENESIQCPLKIDLQAAVELNLVIDPTSCDAADFWSRQSKQPPELIVDYQP